MIVSFKRLVDQHESHRIFQSNVGMVGAWSLSVVIVAFETGCWRVRLGDQLLRERQISLIGWVERWDCSNN